MFISKKVNIDISIFLCNADNLKRIYLHTVRIFISILLHYSVQLEGIKTSKQSRDLTQQELSDKNITTCNDS